MNFTYEVRNLAWVYKHELLEAGWKEKDKIDFETIVSKVGCNYVRNDYKIFAKIRLAVMQQLIPPKYITDKLGEDCVPKGFTEKDILRYTLFVILEIQNEVD
jgi:hypothetical protein